jgi:DNA polymerase
MPVPVKAYVDFETASLAPIRKIGARRYLLDPSTDILMMAWWIRARNNRPQLWLPGEPFPDGLLEHLEDGGLLSGWKSIDFERIAWEYLCVPRHEFPRVPNGIWRDSMHKAAASNLPRSLDAAARSVGAAVQKDKEGHALMLRITNKAKTPVIKPEELDRLGEYCIDDVGAEATTDDGIVEWPQMWPWSEMPRVDREINDHGVLLDIELVRGLSKAADAELIRLDAEMGKITGDPKLKTSNVGGIKKWLLAQGVQLPVADEVAKPPPPGEPEEHIDEDLEKDEDGARDLLPRYRMRKSDIADLLAAKGLSESVRLVLEMRAEAAKASTKKLKSMLLYADPDGRVRACLVLAGAQATLRWSSVGPQFHNLPRDVIPNDKKDGFLLEGAILDGRTGDVDLIRSFWGPVLPFAAKMLRRCLCAPVGHTLLQGDFSQVEARITAWLAGQWNIVEAFARGDDVYKITAAPIFNMRPEDIGDKSYQRQIGKIARLGLGYGGGVNVFVIMGLAYKIRMTREEAAPIVRAWRLDNAATVQYWRDLEAAILLAVQNPGFEYRVGITGLVSYFVMGNCLYCRLPSGRFLRYWAPAIQQSFWPDGKPRGLEVTYIRVKGSATYRAKLYGGLAVENLAQAIAADLLAGGLVRIADAGFKIVLHVHDSIAAEIVEHEAQAALPEFERLMAWPEPWAGGLPVSADCHIGSRFG